MAVDPPADRYSIDRRAHWDLVARTATARNWGRSYRNRLAQLFGQVIPPGSKVLEIGCGPGDLLASLQPGTGVGVDFSADMIRLAKKRFPQLRWLVGDAHDLPLATSFEFIVLSDLVNDLWDVQRAFEQLRTLTTPRTRILINTYSRLWEPILASAQSLNLTRPSLQQNWLTVPDLAGLLHLAEFETLRATPEVLGPLHFPAVSSVLNRFVVKLWPFKHLALTSVLVARPKAQPVDRKPMVSVIVPARNESGNISRIVKEVPEMGAGTELIFVEGHSTDDTYSMIERTIGAASRQRCALLRQTGKGKGDAVRLGFEHASGDVLMIFDADLTVPPEDLPRFYEALTSGKGEFVNGVRLVYPMEKQAMRFLNHAGNKFFSLAFSWLLSQPIKDTLCGTKVLWREDYQRIATNRKYFGDFDPFGDFDLLFGAAKLNLRIIEVPIRYRERKYGDTNIQRWRHGWLLLQMVIFAAKRIKFV